VESGILLRASGATLRAILLRKPKFAYFDYEFDFSFLIDDFIDVIDDMACKCNGKIVLEGRFIS